MPPQTNFFSNGCETYVSHLFTHPSQPAWGFAGKSILLILLAAVYPRLLRSSNEPKPLDREESHLLLSPSEEPALFRHRITLVLQQQQAVVVIVTTEGSSII